MVKQERKEDEGVITLGIFGLIVYAIIRMFKTEYIDTDILVYVFFAFAYLIVLVILLPPESDELDKILRSKSIKVLGYMSIGSLILYTFGRELNIEFLKEIDLILVSLGVIATRFMKFEGFRGD